MKKFLPGLLLVLGLFGYALPSRAATFMTGDSVSLSKGENVADDVYAFGGNLMLTGDIQGDLVAAGGNVLIKGNVAQDLNVAGGTIDVMGDVGDDLRIAGGKVAVQGTVNGDLLIAGGMVQLMPGAVVKGQVHAVGGMLVLDGDVAGNVSLGGSTVILNGNVSGTVDVTADDQVVFGKLSKFAQAVTYSAPLNGDEKTGAVFEQGVQFRKLEPKMAQKSLWQRPDWPKAVGTGIAWYVLQVMALSLAALLALKYARRSLTELAEKTSEGFSGRLIWGFVFLVMAPVLAITLFITLIGSVLGALLLAAYSLAAVLAKIAAGPFVAALLMRWFKGQKRPALNWKWVLLGVAIYQFLWAIPIVGWAVGAIVFVAVFGSLLIEAKGRMKV